MSAGAVLTIAVPVLVLLAVVAFATTSRRRDTKLAAGLSRETRRADRSEVDIVEASDVEAQARERYATAPAPPAREPAPRPVRDPEEIGMTRRQLFNRSILGASAVGGGGLVAGILAFMWPSGAGGFGSKITAAKLEDVQAFIAANKAPFYVPEAKAYLAPYPADALSAGKAFYDDRLFPGMEVGIVALFQTCPHLGCRVPWCPSSQWFECPCHGSKYNRVGEKRGGPAPRGLDRFPVEIAGGSVTIDTGQRITGPEIGTNTTGQEPEGPHCV